MQDISTRLEGKLICLNGFPKNPEFYDIYKKWLESEEVVQGTGGKKQYSLEEIVEFLAQNINESITHWCIYHSNQPIGEISLNRLSSDAEFKDYQIHQYKNPVELTILVIESGKGFGKEATVLALNHAFNSLNIDAIYLTVYINNTRAYTLYQKLGFKILGEKKDKDNNKPEYVMLLTPDSFVNNNL